jgi:hypothetical protein
VDWGKDKGLKHIILEDKGYFFSPLSFNAVLVIPFILFSIPPFFLFSYLSSVSIFHTLFMYMEWCIYLYIKLPAIIDYHYHEIKY